MRYTNSTKRHMVTIPLGRCSVHDDTTYHHVGGSNFKVSTVDGLAHY